MAVSDSELKTLIANSVDISDQDNLQSSSQKLNALIESEPTRAILAIFDSIAAALDGNTFVTQYFSLLFKASNATIDHPEAIPNATLECILSYHQEIEAIYFICAAVTLSRSHPDGLPSELVLPALKATDSVLFSNLTNPGIMPPADEDKNNIWIDGYFRDIADEMWQNAVDHNPVVVSVALKDWWKSHGWTHCTLMLAEKLVPAMEFMPDLVQCVGDVLEAVVTANIDSDLEESPPGDAADPDSAEELLKELKEVQRAAAARVIIESLAGVELQCNDVPRSEHEHEQVNPRADRLIEEYLTAPSYYKLLAEAEEYFGLDSEDLDEEQATRYWAIIDYSTNNDPPDKVLWNTLIRDPELPLVQGIVELLAEMFDANPNDSRIDQLVYGLSNAFEKKPSWIPVEEMQEWILRGLPIKPYYRAMIYASLAAVRPDWIIKEGYLADAFATAVRAPNNKFYEHIGLHCPELLRRFTRMCATDDNSSDTSIAESLIRAIVHVAHDLPEERKAMVSLLEELKPEPLPDSYISLHVPPFEKAIEEIKAAKDRDSS